MNLLIIGGSDAGIAATLRSRELNATARITLVLADEFPNYNICGLPFYVSGETANWRDLAHRTEFPGIEIRTIPLPSFSRLTSLFRWPIKPVRRSEPGIAFSLLYLSAARHYIT